MKVAITADWINAVGGAERVLTELHGMFPEAPIHVALLPASARQANAGWDIRTSFLQRIPFASRRYQAFLPLMPLAFEQFDMREYDLVISSSSACAKGVITRPDAVHICYCHTPSRYLWDLYHEYTAGRRTRVFIAPVAHWLRIWDRVSADRVDQFVANSREVAGRIRKHYRRDSELIYPPVDVERIQPNGFPPEDFYLVVARLVPYKRIDLAVRAATQARRRLVVVGGGSELNRLRALAGPTVEFRGFASDAEVASLLARCRAFLFPGHEDFGIAPVEAQAAGRPVIAYARGGALETVDAETTGIFFEEQTVESLLAAMEELEGRRFDPAAARRNALRFSTEEFRRRFGNVVQRALGQAAPERGGSARWIRSGGV